MTTNYARQRKLRTSFTPHRIFNHPSTQPSIHTIKKGDGNSGFQSTKVQRTANLYSSGITKTIQKVHRTGNIKTAAYDLIRHRCAAAHAYS